jgi:hypothetical protein
MKTNRLPKELSSTDINYIMSLVPSDITRDELITLFAFTKNNDALYLTNDTFTLKYKDFVERIGYKDLIHPDPPSSPNIPTTVGRYIYNLYFNNEKVNNSFFFRINGYVNYTMDKKGVDLLEATLCRAVVNGDISNDEYIEFLNKREWLGFTVVSFLSPSMSFNLIQPLPEVVKERSELFSKYKKELEEDKDVVIASEIEKKLLAIAAEKLKNEPSMELYNSGASKGFNNSYKNTSVMRGIISKSDDPDNFIISQSNLVDGIPPSELEYYTDLSTEAFYARAVDTRIGGYLSKQLSAAFQTVKVGPPHSDCGTKKVLEVVLTPQLAKLIEFRYIVVNGKLVELTPEIMKKNLGKLIKLRTPLYCLNDDICNHCAGELPYKLGIMNIGLTFSDIGSSILQLALKKFHNSAAKISLFNPNDYLDEVIKKK